ncbi:sensor histidine kinase [Aquipseudomonas alcaligenes]|uniref:histidine kinase n=1 Tax=Aquipseudomonas alcaligenes TaxID=43263 RepID=A0AB73I057_AQUAC|nr:sensor histidine kinase [Pseudomonas alcaligenes]MDH0143517.1 sensor histidine kinase [Pseudomonas alcaligenes]
MKSIQRRLSLGLASVLIVVGLILAQSSLWLFDHSLRRYLREDLKDETQTLLVALVRGQNGVQLDERRLDPTFQRPFSGHYFRIDFADETWRSRSLWDRDLPKPARAGLQDGLGDGPRGQLLLVYRGDYQRFGQRFSISVAQDYTPILESFRRLQWLGLGLGAAALLLILLAQRYTVRSALRPLERVREQIAQLQQGRRTELDSQVPQELEPLVAQVNHLLSHTEDTLKRSRNALGNLGHALKTPLAVLVSLSEREELRDQPELQATLREQLAQIRQRLERELGRARLAGEALPGAHFDCAAELPGLFSTLGMIHSHGLNLEWQAEPGLCLPWDREDLLELLGNLLDNACKWADAEVRLSLVQEGEGYRLWVDDDGPGIAPERREAVLGRGTRLDEQVAGHGLGLGIVRDMVEAWGGSLSLEDSPLGGLRVAISLPGRR